jgi:hypothetical protein
LNVLVADLGPSSLAPGDVFNFTFTGGTPSGCYRIVEKTAATPTDGAIPLLFYVNCAACEATLVTPTPTNTSTPTPSVTNTQTPTNTETPTPTGTPSETPAETPTNTPTETETPTPTETPTNTPTPTQTQTPGLYTIGQAALGGIIAYIDGGGTSGTSGLVATVSDISTDAEWGCYETSITGATGTTIGTGNANTIAIMEGCETAGIAARLCGDLVQGGYSDWYLPSKDELNALWVNRAAIGGFVNLQGYWSSTQIDSNDAWDQVFNQGTQNPTSKFGPLYVRAIRSFGT